MRTRGRKLVDTDKTMELWRRPTVKIVFKWANPGLFFVYFQSFQTNITIFTTIIWEKCPSSIRSQGSFRQVTIYCFFHWYWTKAHNNRFFAEILKFLILINAISHCMSQHKRNWLQGASEWGFTLSRRLKLQQPPTDVSMSSWVSPKSQTYRMLS